MSAVFEVTAMSGSVGLVTCNQGGYPWFCAVNLGTGEATDWVGPAYDFYDVPPHLSDERLSHSKYFTVGKLSETSAIYVSSSLWHKETAANYTISLSVNINGVTVGNPTPITLETGTDSDGDPERVFPDNSTGGVIRTIQALFYTDASYLDLGRASFLYRTIDGYAKLAFLGSSGLIGHADTSSLGQYAVLKKVHGSDNEFFINATFGRRLAYVDGSSLIQRDGSVPSAQSVFRIGTGTDPLYSDGRGFYQFFSNDTSFAVGVDAKSWALMNLGTNVLQFYERFGSSNKDARFASTREEWTTQSGVGRWAHNLIGSGRDVLLDWNSLQTGKGNVLMLSRFTLPVLTAGGWSIHFILMSPRPPEES